MAELPSQLSNETTFTRWANPATSGPIRNEPKKGSRVITHLHFQTEDKQAEVYLTLRSEVDKEGTTWILIRIPGKPNGRKGWVEQEDLNPLQLIHTSIVINRSTLKLTLSKNGKKVMSAPVGVGKSSTPTPAGDFWIREKLRSLGSAYGPWAIGTAAYSSISDWPGAARGRHPRHQPALPDSRPAVPRLRADEEQGDLQVGPQGTARHACTDRLIRAADRLTRAPILRRCQPPPWS